MTRPETTTERRMRERRERIRAILAKNHADGLHRPPVKGCADCEAQR